MELHKRYTLYVDESGVANLTEMQTKYFVLTGIVAEESIDRDLSSYFHYIKRRYDLPESESFHATSFFQPKHKKKNPLGVTEAKAKDFCSSIAEFVNNTPFEVMVVAIKKRDVEELLKMPKGYGFKGSAGHKKDKDIVYEIAARKLFLQFASLLKKRKAHGAIVAESRRKSDVVLIDTFLDCHDEGRFTLASNKKSVRDLKERVVSICFKNKRAVDGALQIADLFSYTVYQYLCKTLNDSKKKRGLGILWKTCSKRIKGNTNELKVLLSQRTIRNVASDRINKITVTIQSRLAANSDLVNPTRR